MTRTLSLFVIFSMLSLAGGAAEAASVEVANSVVKVFSTMRQPDP